MKDLAIALLFTTSFAIFDVGATEAGVPVQVRIEVSLKGVNESWVTGLLMNHKGLRDLPPVATRSGSPVVIEAIREYRTNTHSHSEPLIRCGAEFSLTPLIVEGNIRIFGTSILRRPVKGENHENPRKFEVQENVIDLRVRSGEKQEIRFRNGGKMIISATLLDPAGNPISKSSSNKTADSTR